MEGTSGYIHNGSGSLPLRRGFLHAQLPLAGGGLVRFGARIQRFDGHHFRLFRDPDEVVVLPHGTSLTVRTSLPEDLDLAGIRLRASVELGDAAQRVRQAHVGEALPVSLRASAALRRLDEALVARVEALSSRIDQLPGRARYKRVDTYLRLERARDHLEDHFAEDPGTDVLAAQAAISRAHFIRLFGAFYGVTPKQRVLELKVEAAKRLLVGTQLTIWEVAMAAGFGNRCAFQRLFRDRVGMTPGQFRAASEAKPGRGVRRPAAWDPCLRPES